MDENQTIDVYYDMDIAQICQHFNKTRNTVDKAVAKLVKDYPDKDYKYKNPDTKRITIKAEGVEKLSTYFRKEKNEISTVEMELRYENEKLKLELEKSKQTFLIEQQTKEEQIQKLETEKSELIKENQNLQQKIEDVSELQKELEEHKKKESEYNSKSFFYRLLHKI